MSKCKYTYTEDQFPTNTGSLHRPARFNLRLTCQARARTHAVFSGFRKEFGLADSTNYAALFETKLLPTLEAADGQVAFGQRHPGCPSHLPGTTS